MKRIGAAVAVGVFWAGTALGQGALGPSAAPPASAGVSGAATVPTPVYDAVSIKLNKSPSGGFSWGTHDDFYQGTNIPLDRLITDAYGFRSGLIFGLPKWAEDEHFDVIAKVTDADVAAMKKLTRAQRQAMLAAVLEERFGLKVHTETKTLGIFDLVAAKDGPKLKEIAPETAEEKAAREAAGQPKLTPGSTGPLQRGSMRFGPGTLDASGIPMETLVSLLESQTDKKIVDQTGLHGKYDVHLKYAPEGRETDELPTLLTALEEQLGLKLKADKGPVETLVVDQVKEPSAN